MGLVIINGQIKMSQKVTFKKLVGPLVRHGGSKREFSLDVSLRLLPRLVNMIKLTHNISQDTLLE